MLYLIENYHKRKTIIQNMSFNVHRSTFFNRVDVDFDKTLITNLFIKQRKDSHKKNEYTVYRTQNYNMT